ncbi:hypothetical protein H4219_002879 [Mycoemilia scoparia]|uniref:Uncharacterized protein n=1 Tax=Mycoemilia scoparia TaxID=417184 RepID=A0A9W8A2V4_9FUNG|nr:hypothetical protein H4219_002879 [Mycoemilia scoparia]
MKSKEKKLDSNGRNRMNELKEELEKIKNLREEKGVVIKEKKETDEMVAYDPMAVMNGKIILKHQNMSQVVINMMVNLFLNILNVDGEDTESDSESNESGVSKLLGVYGLESEHKSSDDDNDLSHQGDLGNEKRSIKKRKVEGEFPPMPPGTPPLFPEEIAIQGVWPPLPLGPPPDILPMQAPPVLINPAMPAPPPPPPGWAPPSAAPQRQEKFVEPKKATQPALSAAPQERDLRKELTTLVPSHLLRQRRMKQEAKPKISLPQLNAAPDTEAPKESSPEPLNVNDSVAPETQTKETKSNNTVPEKSISELPGPSLLLGVNYSSGSDDDDDDDDDNGSDNEDNPTGDLSSKLLKELPQIIKPGQPKISFNNLTKKDAEIKSDKETIEEQNMASDDQYEEFMNEISGLM